MVPRRVDKVERREDILAAATRVFARKGFAASRIDDVAAEAGIAKGSVYLYFDSREELLRAAFEAFARRSQEVLAATAQDSAPALERLAGLVRSVTAELAAQPELARVMLDLWSAGAHDTVRGQLDMAAVYREYRRTIAGLLERAAEEGGARPGLGQAHAAVVVGAVEGCLLQWLVEPGLDLAALAEPILEVLIRGLAAHPGAGGGA